MDNAGRFYIDGAWVEPLDGRPLEVVNPATEEVIARISLGGAADADRAVAAAREAFHGYAQTGAEERLALLERIRKVFKRRWGDLASAISSEMGAPITLANELQAAAGLGHLVTAASVLKSFRHEELRGTTMVVREPIGVCAFITPWNWPINQIACKVFPAIAAGCTCVLKPSEMAPLNAILFAEILHEAGVPKGVFNLVNGDGAGVGQALVAHPGVDLVSFTGSTRAGIQVAKLAADTVKRVQQELGGKSANLILQDADLEAAVRDGVQQMMRNSGQSCNAPSRMLVHVDQYEQAVAIARAAAESVRVGDPRDPGTTMGPLASRIQYERVQGYIERGLDEGARLATGGPGRPEGLERGYYTRPTVFADVQPGMTIAREEIFGPVLSLLSYRSEDDAVAIANDSPYGLSGYVFSGDLEHARRIAARLRTGMVHINGAPLDAAAPFGGYRQSGNGREWGVNGFEEFFEVKAVMGYQAA
jgi:aldehyde dehydrogenase (NAD+)